jgi:hypothetical protein
MRHPLARNFRLYERGEPCSDRICSRYVVSTDLDDNTDYLHLGQALSPPGCNLSYLVVPRAECAMHYNCLR